jgi:hypothetical protein
MASFSNTAAAERRRETHSLFVADTDMTKDDDSDGKYSVGKNKTPIHTRFQKGVSGNYAGRPKGSGAFAFHVERDGLRKVRVNENGQSRLISNNAMASRQLNRQAAQGNLKAIALKGQFETKANLTSGSTGNTVVVPAISREALRRAAEAYLRDEEDRDDADSKNE